MEMNYKAKIKKLLALPAEQTVRTIVPMGVPEKEVKQNTRKAFEERVTYR